MLGLGYIDKQASNGIDIYIIQYDIDDEQHFSLSLPTRKIDGRYPEAPVIELGYGIEPNPGECNPSIDENGYARFENTRYINLRRAAFYYEKIVPPFYESSTPYIFNTAAIQFGVRHCAKTNTNTDAAQLKAVMAMLDEDYSDQGGSGEEMGVLNSGEFSSPVFVHRATETGYQHYALYTINWFSRTHNSYEDSLSNFALSDNTAFPYNCGIINPPTDASAQVIFKETTPILTTGTEQAMLNPDASNLVVRVKYKWRPPADGASSPDGLPFVIPDKVEFYFRETEAAILHGVITSAEDQGCGSCLLTLTISNGNTLDSSFAGSIIVANEMPYVVKEVNGASTVLIEGIPNNGIIIPTDSAAAYIDTNYILPQGGDLFVLTENLSEHSAWTYLNHIEPIDAAGISQTANVTPVPPDPDFGLNYSGVYDLLVSSIGNSGNSFGGAIEIDGQGYNVVDSYVDPNNSNVFHLIVVDPEYDAAEDDTYVPWGSSLDVVYYPGVKIYLNDGNSDLTFSMVYPGGNDISKVTYLGLRAVDTVSGCASSMTPPIAMVAVGYQPPVQPELTRLLDYATRPDFYGKSSYTFQAGFSETPHAVIFYRADGKSILERLYTATTLNDILANNPLDFIIENLDVLINGDPANSQLPPPDNLKPGLDIEQTIKTTVAENFIPLTKTPLLYDKINSDLASPKPPTAANPYPMVVKQGNDLLFTDFTLDGANNSVVFYCGIGMNNRLEMSDPSDIVGPIRLINSYPPKPLAIKKITTRLPDTVQGIPISVEFEVNPFVASENIKQYKIYRTEEAVKSLSIHSMSLVKTIETGEVIRDDFSGSDFIPFGEPLFYRLVALREIVDENDQLEFVPSFPSEVALASVVDTNNPDAPILSYTGTEILNGGGEVQEIQEVTLSWAKTVHNGKYYLYKMNNSGNWQKIYELESNELNLSVDLADTIFGYGTLSKLSGNGNTIYHHFKVQAENASGLLSLDEQRLTI